MHARALIALLLCLGSASAFAQERPPPRYMATLRAELEAVSLPASCEAVSESRAHCSFRHVDPEAQREILVHIVYSDSTDTVYIYVPRLVTAMPDDPAVPALLRRIAELNWTLLGAKLEWNPSDGEVRLSTVMHTDSNFDRRAFRGLLRMVTQLADRYGPELDRLVASVDP
jgi:hypothetical protein